MGDDSAQKAQADASDAFKRGLLGNVTGLATLFGVAYALGLVKYAAIALGIQYAVFFVHGLPNRSEKFYDLSGSVTHFAVVLLALMETRSRTGRQLFVAVASTVWMTRLGTFLYLRVLRDGKDARFDAIKPYPLRFMSFWTIQALWVFLIQLPVLLLNAFEDNGNTTYKYPQYVEMALMATWFVGFAIEYVADTAKMDFRNKPENRHKYITGGIWSLCRHPNYFGEILMWTVIATLATVVAIEQSKWYLLASWLSPGFTSFLLLKVTGIPLVSKAGIEKWGKDPDYMHYINNTSVIIPWFPAAPRQNKKQK